MWFVLWFNAGYKVLGGAVVAIQTRIIYHHIFILIHMVIMAVVNICRATIAANYV